MTNPLRMIMNLMCSIVSLSFHLLCSIFVLLYCDTLPSTYAADTHLSLTRFERFGAVFNATTLCICIMPFFGRIIGKGRYVG